MRIKDYFSLSFLYLRHRALRTVLTVIGVSISIILISSLLIVGSSLKASVTEQFKSVAPNVVFISVKSKNFMQSASTKGLEKEDCKDLYKLSYVDVCAYFNYKYAKIEYNGKKTIASVTVTSRDFFQNMDKFGIGYDGKPIRRTDEVILGHLYATDKVFDKPVRLGDQVIINGKKYKVVGLVNEIGNPQDDSNIYVLDEDEKKGKANMLLVLLNDMSKLEYLKKYFDRKKNKEFSYFTMDAMLKQVNDIVSIINYAVLAVALISLIVGTIGISNTLFTSVSERTKDIGIMKALGSKNSDIFMLVLAETFIIIFFGTSLGIACGMGIAKVATMVMTRFGYKLPFVFELRDLLFTIGFSILFGFISAIFPAKDAVKLDPIVAIRK